MDTTEWPLVSVVAACYNHAKYLEETLDSIRLQSYPNIRLIITDDGSKDDSKAKIKAWVDRHQMEVTLVFNATNEGICKTFNKGLAATKGQYFQVIACDDVMVLDKLEQQVAFLEKQSEEVAVVYTDAKVIDKDSQALHDSFDAFWNFPREQPQNMFEHLILQNSIIAPSSLVRTSAMRALGGFDENLCFEDWDMWLRLASAYKIVKMKPALVKYRHFETSMSQGSTFKDAIARDSVFLLEKHLGISKEIDELVRAAQRPRITALIENNAASIGMLWRKLKYEKSPYSLYLFICALLGINQQKAHAIKKKLYR